VPVPSVASSNLTVRGRATGLGCWGPVAVPHSVPLARAGAMGASLGPPAAVGAGSQADAAFFLSSNTFSPCINWEFTSFCLPSGIGAVEWV